MRPAPAPTPSRTPDARRPQVAAACLAAAGWIGWALAAPGNGASALLVAATAGSTAAAVLHWCRHLSTRQVATATATVEHDRLELLETASTHAARWQAIVDTANEGIVTIDVDGRIETFNGAAEKLFGRRAADVIGANVTVLMPEPFHSQHDGYLQRYLTTGERRIIGIGREVVGKRSDGSLFPIDLSVGEGRIGGKRFFTAVIRDITERKEMQTKLAQSERLAAVGELAAGIAHEVNNPVNTIINCAQLIRDGDAADENCTIIIEEGERIAEIVKDLLQFARDDRDRPQPTSLHEVVQRTLRLLQEGLKRHGVRLVVDVPDDLPQVKARPQQIQQVLLNLLINAKDALLQGGGGERRIEIGASPHEHGVRMVVRDNGPGVPESLGNRVFEPFVTTKRARGGTGLGLSISKSIVEGYGGTIDIASRPGEGAEFRVWLPLADRTE
jgi:two-component system sensor kinase FixL